jgi:hypothetical protein
MSVGQMSVCQISVGQMSVGQMVFDDKTWKVKGETYKARVGSRIPKSGATTFSIMTLCIMTL